MVTGSSTSSSTFTSGWTLGADGHRKIDFECRFFPDLFDCFLMMEKMEKNNSKFLLFHLFEPCPFGDFRA